MKIGDRVALTSNPTARTSDFEKGQVVVLTPVASSVRLHARLPDAAEEPDGTQQGRRSVSCWNPFVLV